MRPWLVFTIALAACGTRPEGARRAGQSASPAVVDGGAADVCGSVGAGEVFSAPVRGCAEPVAGFDCEKEAPAGVAADVIWTGGANDTWVASGDLLAHWDGRGWARSRLCGETPLSIKVIQGQSGNVWALADPGTLMHLTSAGWEQAWSGQGELDTLWVQRAAGVWAAGVDSTTRSTFVLHWDGQLWRRWSIDTAKANAYGGTSAATLPLVFWGTGDSDVWLVGYTSAGNSSGHNVSYLSLFHWDGATWTTQTGQWRTAGFLPDPPQPVCFAAEGDVVCWSGRSWSSQGPPGLLSGFRSCETGTVFVGPNSQFDGSAPIVPWPQLALPFLAYDATDATNAWLVEEGGAVWRYDGARWVSLTPTLLTLWPTSSDVWAAGYQAAVIHGHGGVWTAAPSPGFEVESLQGRSDQDLYAFGWGELSHWDGLRWISVPPPDGGFPGNVLLQPDATHLWVAGALPSGIIDWNGTSWSAMPSPPGEVRALWARARDDVWAAIAGESGNTDVAWHWDGSKWSSAPMTESTFANPDGGAPIDDSGWLVAVSGTADEVWFISASGKLIRWDGSVATVSMPFPPGNPPHDLQVVSATEAYALVDGEYRALYAWDGVTWSKLIDRVNSYRATATDLWVVGEGPRILHRSKLAP